MEGKEASLNNSSDLVVDRISPLSDSILGAILSLLPTKNAVATSALSKRWEFVWKIVHNLDFYYGDHKYDMDADHMKFVSFVNRVMLLHDSGSLNKFRLDCHARTISSHVNSWINIAVTKNVHELYLSLGSGEILPGEIFGTPIRGFSCDSLRSLELSYVSFVCDATGSSSSALNIASIKLSSKSSTEIAASTKP